MSGCIFKLWRGKRKGEICGRTIWRDEFCYNHHPQGDRLKKQNNLNALKDGVNAFTKFILKCDQCIIKANCAHYATGERCYFEKSNEIVNLNEINNAINVLNSLLDVTRDQFNRSIRLESAKGGIMEPETDRLASRIIKILQVFAELKKAVPQQLDENNEKIRVQDITPEFVENVLKEKVLEKDFNSIKYYLQQNYPEKYGERATVAVANECGKPFAVKQEFDYSKLNAEQLKQLIAILATVQQPKSD